MEPLTPPQQQALSLLAAGQGIEEISRSLKINRSTLWRWRQEPQFIAEWNQLLHEMKEGEERALLELQQKAMSALEDCLGSTNEMVKLRASLTILDKIEGLKVGATEATQILRNQQQAARLEELFSFT